MSDPPSEMPVEAGSKLDLELQKLKLEVQKLKSDIANGERSFALAKRSALASILAPILTAITVIGTVYLGYSQLTLGKQANEDANWRQIIGYIVDGKSSTPNSLPLSSLLKPFFPSERYKVAARGLAVELLPKISDPQSFRDLLGSTFSVSNLTDDDFQTLLDLDRDLAGQMSPLWNGDAKVAIPAAWYTLQSEILGLCPFMEAILRDPARMTSMQKLQKGKQISFSNLYVEECDFSGVDFTQVALENSTFNWVKLDDAVLNIKEQTPNMWNAIVWWRARSVDRDLLLLYLLQNFKPYQPWPNLISNGYRPDAAVSESDWVSNITRLCNADKVECPKDAIAAHFPK